MTVFSMKASMPVSIQQKVMTRVLTCKWNSIPYPSAYDGVVLTIAQKEDRSSSKIIIIRTEKSVVILKGYSAIVRSPNPKRDDAALYACSMCCFAVKSSPSSRNPKYVSKPTISLIGNN
jgi:hypothetical protein